MVLCTETNLGKEDLKLSEIGEFGWLDRRYEITI
jgi:hypothetical protein